MKFCIKKSSLLLIVLLMFSFSLSSCKSTPEERIVQNKNNDNLLDLIKNSKSNASDNTLISKNVCEHFENKTNTVCIDINANIILPNVSKLPVATAVPKMLTQEDVKHIIDVLIGNQKIYYYNDQLTKSDIDQIILKLKEDKAIAKADHTISNQPNGAAPMTPDKYDDIIQDYENMYSDAPIKKDFQDIDYSQINKNGYSLNAQTKPIDGFFKDITISYDPAYGSEVAFYNPAFITHTYKRVLDKIPDNLTINKDDAINQAVKIVNDIGIEDMDIVSVVADERTVDYYNYHFLIKSVKTPYYQITFARTIEKVPSNYDYRYFYLNNDKYSNNDYYEYIYVFINDSGLLSFEWYCPMNITETLNSDVGILSFDKILNIAKNQISVENTFINDEKIDKMAAQIDTIQLGMMRVKMPNKPGNYMYVPVWDFIGKYKYHYKSPVPKNLSLDANDWLNKDNTAKSIITINAIDGTIINRDLGY